MILGIGLDLLLEERISKICLKKCNIFVNKILSDEEKINFGNFKDYKKKINFLAKIFSSKESFLKAAGVGIGRGFELKNITVAHDISGKPFIKLDEEIKKFLKMLFSNFEKFNILLTITDQGGFINTCVIIEGE